MTGTIRIGQVDVAPGERATIDLPITDLSTHTPMTMPVQVVNGRQDGPRLFVCAALHGDEINGVEIIRRLLKAPAIRRQRGALIAVPIVNVFGFVSQERYLPDRRDLNRSFPGSAKGSLASRLAHVFMSEIVANATHGIDLHTGALHRANYPQIRANLDDAGADRLARAFGVPIVINAGFREGSLREAAARAQVPVIVYEAGEALRFDELSIRAGLRGIIRSMRALGMLPARPDAPAQAAHQPIVQRSSSWVRAPRSGVLRSTVALGRHVQDGGLLGRIADPFGENEVEVRAHLAGIVVGRTNLPVVHEGEALFHIVRSDGTRVEARALDAFESQAERPGDAASAPAAGSTPG